MDRQKLATFVLGGVTGAIAGILAAPRSGRELRGSISDRAGEARERGRESYFEARERARERRAGRRAPSSPQDETREMTLGEIVPDTSGSNEEPGRARLRAVAPEDEASPAEDRDEIRRRIDQTRQRLRGRRG